MIALIGLGNPGSAYLQTRHNIGFMTIDKIAKNYENFIFIQKNDSLISRGYIDKNEVILIKPQSYMNNSGISVARILNFYKLKTTNVFVFYDDLDTKMGKIKYKNLSGCGGHNGIKSLNANIGKEYNKIKIGIGRPENKNDISNYVLQNFSKNETKIIDLITDIISSDITNIITDTIHTISKINNKLQNLIFVAE